MSVKLFSRRPRIDDALYGRLMTSFGRVVDADPFVARPAGAVAQRVAREFGPEVELLDRLMYAGATEYHLRLLAGSWIMSRDGDVPARTAEVFEEAVAWRFGPLVRGADRLPRRVGELARGELKRVD